MTPRTYNFGKGRDFTEEELFRIASRSSSMREVARELDIPTGSFWRHLSKDDNQEIRQSLEEILADHEYRQEGPQHYYYDGDHYIFELGFLDRPYVIRREIWEGVCASYSRTGENLTKAEVAREYDIPRANLEAALTKYGFYKSSPPYTHEQLMDADNIDDLADQSLEQRQHRFQESLQNKETSYLRKEVEKLWEEKEASRKTLSGLADEFKSLVGEVEIPMGVEVPPVPETGWEAHIPLADVHAGLYTWGEELWGRNYDLDIACDRIVTHAREVAMWIKGQEGCKTGWMTDVGDTFHGLLNQTERGTPMQQDTRARKVWRRVVEAKIEALEIISSVVPEVKVVATPGNHDGLFNYLLYESLDMYFSKADNIQILTTVTPQSYFIVGSTMHLIIHGTKIGQLTAPKAKSMIELIARNSAGDDFQKVKRIKAYVGHLHNSQGETHGAHLELIRLPAVAETDDYAQSLGFFHRPGARAFRLDEDGDIDTEKRISF